MEAIVSMIKNYFILMLLLLFVSYLTPKESYKKYMQFFVGTWLFILLLQPVIGWIKNGEEISDKSRAELQKQLEHMEKWEGEGTDVFEHIYLDQKQRQEGEEKQE